MWSKKPPFQSLYETWQSIREHPFVWLLRIILIVAMFIGFFWAMNFFVAITPAEALAKWGKVMPLEWEAGVMNHGKYFQWYLIARHPFAFIGALAWCLMAIFGICYTEKLLHRPAQN